MNSKRLHSLIWLTTFACFFCDGVGRCQATRGEDFSDLVKKVVNAVVLIQGELPDGQSVQASGVMIENHGYFLSTAHDISRARQLRVQLKDGREFPCDLLRMDETADVALLRVNAQELPELLLGDPSQLEPGESVVAIGAPLGLGWSVSTGVVSSIERTLHGVPIIQTTLPVNPGSSGGPVFNRSGLLVGLIKGKVTNPSGIEAEGLNLIVPITAVSELLAKEGLFRESASNPSPNTTTAKEWFNRGVLAEDSAKKVAAYKRAVSLDPNLAEAHYNLGILHYTQKDYEDASTDFQKAAELKPNSPKAHNNLGQTYRQLGKMGEAETEFLKALELNPDYEMAHFNLGVLYGEDIGDPMRATKHYREYLRLRPDAADADQVKAWIAEAEKRSRR